MSPSLPKNRHIKNLTDLRVIKTKENIRLSFLDLLDEHDYDDITIAHILQKAQINRTTFYKHYANKHDLATQLIDEMMATLILPLFEKYAHQSFLNSLERVMMDLETHALLICQLWKIDSPKISLKHITHKIMAQKYLASHPKQTSPNENLALQSNLYASFMLSVIEIIINDGHLCPDELFKNTRAVLTKML